MIDYSAPCFYVSISGPGSTVEERAPQERLLSLSFEDTEKKASKTVIAVDNYDLSQIGSPLWQPGNTVAFQFGYPGAMSPIRRKKIQKVKGFNPLMIELLSDEVVMGREARTAPRWEQAKRSEVVREIAARYGYTGEQVHIEDTAIRIPQISQAGRTDLELVRYLAEREGYEFYVDFDGLHFHPQNLKQSPLRTLTYFTERGRGDIESITTEDDRGKKKPGAVTLQMRDPMTKETVLLRGDDSTTANRTTLASERTLFAGNDEGAPPGGTVAQSTVRWSTESTAAAAQRQASGLYKQQQMMAITLTLGMRGDAGLLAKSNVYIEGLGPALSGLYYVVSAKHEVGSGYKMNVKVKRDGKNAALGAGGFASTTAPSKKAQQNSAPAASEAPVLEERLFVLDPQTGEYAWKMVPTGGRSSGT